MLFPDPFRFADRVEHSNPLTPFLYLTHREVERFLQDIHEHLNDDPVALWLERRGEEQAFR